MSQSLPSDPGKALRAFLVMLAYLIVSGYVLMMLRPSPQLFFAAFGFIFLGAVFIRLWAKVSTIA